MKKIDNNYLDKLIKKELINIKEENESIQLRKKISEMARKQVLGLVESVIPDKLKKQIQGRMK